MVETKDEPLVDQKAEKLVADWVEKWVHSEVAKSAESMDGHWVDTTDVLKAEKKVVMSANHLDKLMVGWKADTRDWTKAFYSVDSMVEK